MLWYKGKPQYPQTLKLSLSHKSTQSPNEQGHRPDCNLFLEANLEYNIICSLFNFFINNIYHRTSSTTHSRDKKLTKIQRVQIIENTC